MLDVSLADTTGATETEYRVDIAAHLLRSGDKSAAPMNTLLQALGDGNEFIRRRAAMALAGTGHADGALVLAETLKFDNEVVVRDAIGALSSLGPAANSVLPYLREALTLSDNADTSSLLRETIAKIEGK